MYFNGKLIEKYIIIALGDWNKIFFFINLGFDTYFLLTAQ